MELVHPVISATDIEGLRSQVRNIHAENKLITFITSIVGNTRAHKSIYLGASPRASIGILNGSKAYGGHAWQGFRHAGRHRVHRTGRFEASDRPEP